MVDLDIENPGADEAELAQAIADLGGGGTSIHGTDASSDIAPGTAAAHGGNAFPQAATNTAGANLELSGGIGRRFFTVVDFSALAGLTVTIRTNNVPVVFTEGVDWDAETSNAVTATNLAAAIGATAQAVGSVVYITPASTARQLTITTDAAPDLTATSGPNGSISFGPETVVGQDAGLGNTATEITAYGRNAVKDNTGDTIAAFGALSALNNTGQDGTFFGFEAGEANAGSFVTFLGRGSGQNNTGNQVVAVGKGAATDNTGDDFVCVGDNAGINNTGDAATFVGRESGSNNTFDNVTVLGAFAAATADNTVQIGEAATVLSGRIGGAVTVASLPAASVGAGHRAFVTDSNATLAAGIGNTVAGGGANFVPVHSDGSNWKIG